ncbi:uncharacterized protein LOC128252010 isoform X2 [Drosophila gunungcola]|uniref:uncharacterized protein LOC128252010 isoform X2 n=1 Tax=Drosophila gunungcola TaxID=103775 RepID=UPI0022DF3875|nr:uncharacterized protein LOC128252010 isoform X2 [Drosophila gunungcola]
MDSDNNKSGMESAISVFLENVDEKEQVRRYSLQSLRDRLRQGIQQHQEVVQSTVQLLKEVGDVVNMMQLGGSGHQGQPTKIRRLIVGFEAINSANASQIHSVEGISLSSNLTEIHSLLVELEHLNESAVLGETQKKFKRARESLEKALDFLEKRSSESPRPFPQVSQLTGCPSASRSLREKIEAFNKVLEVTPEKLDSTGRHFTDCFCSCCSLAESPESGGHKPLPSASKTNSGYEGDIDSEVEQTDKSSNDFEMETVP